MRRARAAAVAALFGTVLLAGATANATPRTYEYAYEPDQGAEGDADIEQWLDWWRPFGSNLEEHEFWRWWIGGTATIMDRLSVSTFIVTRQNYVEHPIGTTQDVNGNLRLDMLYAQAKYVLVDPAAHDFVPFVQLEYCMPFTGTAYDGSGTYSITTEHTLSERFGVGWHNEDFRAVANLVSEQVLSSPQKIDVAWNLAAAWVPIPAEPWPPVTVGLEAYGETNLFGGLIHGGRGTSVGLSTLFAGPALSYSKGRFWSTLSATIELTDVTSHAINARLMVGFEL